MSEGKFSESIKKYRRISEMTQRDVAEKIGVDRTTYAKYESGKANPQFGTVLKIAKLFEVNVDDICGTEFLTPRFGDMTTLDSEEVRLITDYRTLSDMRKTEILRVLKRLTGDQKKEDARLAENE